VQSAIVSVVGDDFPQEYLDLLTSRNIDISDQKYKVVKLSLERSLPQ
jgi:hypothetical protein